MLLFIEHDASLMGVELCSPIPREVGDDLQPQHPDMAEVCRHHGELSNILRKPEVTAKWHQSIAFGECFQRVFHDFDAFRHREEGRDIGLLHDQDTHGWARCLLNH